MALLIRCVRANWTDGNVGVVGATAIVSQTSVPRRNWRMILNYYIDWRSHGCEAFTESQQGKNHSISLLGDAHEDLEGDIKQYLEGKLKSRKSDKLTVASFAKEVNEVIVPRHANLKSSFIDRHGVTPFISHTVAWLYMNHLGFKYGSLKKGMIQDHERKDVKKKRVEYVKEWMVEEASMHCWRMVDVSKARARLEAVGNFTAPTTNKDDLISLFKFENVKQEKQLSWK